MKRKLSILFLAVVAIALLPTRVQANDYLEKQSHYSVMATGQDVIHFVIPVYAYGASNDYYVHKTSYIYIDNIEENGTTQSGSTTIAKAYSKRSADDSENKEYSGGKDSAYLEMSKGKAIVTSTYSGINEVVNEGSGSGKVLNLTPNRKITFVHGNVYGCADGEPVVFTTSGSETQNIVLFAGWNWISTNLAFTPDKAPLNTVMSGADMWKEGDLIKNPANRQFSTYSETQDAFMGKLTGWDYTQMYMVYTKNGNTLRLNGDKLSNDSIQLTLRGDGQWSALPCLLDHATTITEAMADYYEHATAGDIIKSHGHFAYFSADKQWKGDLTALRPGEGYLMRRMGAGDVTVRFYNTPAAATPQNAPAFQGNGATNMTMITRVQSNEVPCTKVMAYVGDELVGVATQIDSLYFLTIATDKTGEVHFRTEDGTPLVATTNDEQPMTIGYTADSHHGSLKAPIILKPAGDPDRVRKVIEDNHVVIIRNNEKYDVTGKKLK